MDEETELLQITEHRSYIDYQKLSLILGFMFFGVYWIMFMIVFTLR